MDRKLGGDQSFHRTLVSPNHYGRTTKDKIYQNLWLLRGLHLTFPLYDQYRNDYWLIPCGGDSTTLFQLRRFLTLVIYCAFVHFYQNGLVQSHSIGKVGIILNSIRGDTIRASFAARQLGRWHQSKKKGAVSTAPFFRFNLNVFCRPAA